MSSFCSVNFMGELRFRNYFLISGLAFGKRDIGTLQPRSVPGLRRTSSNRPLMIRLQSKVFGREGRLRW
jgi:hypothetical protein